MKSSRVKDHIINSFLVDLTAPVLFLSDFVLNFDCSLHYVGHIEKGYSLNIVNFRTYDVSLFCFLVI